MFPRDFPRTANCYGVLHTLMPGVSDLRDERTEEGAVKNYMQGQGRPYAARPVPEQAEKQRGQEDPERPDYGLIDQVKQDKNKRRDEVRHR